MCQWGCRAARGREWRWQVWPPAFSDDIKAFVLTFTQDSEGLLHA